MYKIIFFAFFIKFSQGLVCYQCDSSTTGSLCKDPFNTDEIQPLDCSQNLARSNFTTDYECVNEEKIYAANNLRTHVRKCQERNYNSDYCRTLQQLGVFQGFRVEKCDVCYTDRCNSSQNVKLSLVLNLIFFYVFYECTKF